MFVRIYNPQFERTKEVLPGEEVVFGRGVHDVGELPNNSLVSHRHGVIAATESGFSVTSIGTYSGFVVRDTMTPSRLHLPQGMGPIELPFANAIISFDHGVPGQIQVAVVGSDRADLWEQRWGPEEQHDEEVELHDRQTRWRTTAAARPQAQGTRGALHLVLDTRGDVRGRDHGRVGGRANQRRIGRRLGYDTNIIERHLSSIYEALDIDPHEQQRPRDTAVRRAVDRGLVTREQLHGLHERTVRSTGDD